MFEGFMRKVVDGRELRELIEAQRCPWCDRNGLRSLSNHTVRAHGIYADELRELAGLARDAPLCSPELSDVHRELAREQGTGRWLHRPEVRLAAAATREASLDDHRRKRRIEHLNAVRPMALEALRRTLEAERNDPELAARRRLARSLAHRAFRTGAECSICGAWFCSVTAPGRDYRQRRTCSRECRREALRRARTRGAVLRALETAAQHRAGRRGAVPDGG